MNELDRVIAEHLEPNPQWTGQPITTAYSIGGFWEGRWTSNGVCEFLRPAKSFTTDPAMTVMLIKKLLECDCLAFSKWISGPEMFVCVRGNWNDGGFDHDKDGYQASPDFGLLVANAYLCAKDIEVQ